MLTQNGVLEEVKGEEWAEAAVKETRYWREWRGAGSQGCSWVMPTMGAGREDRSPLELEAKRWEVNGGWLCAVQLRPIAWELTWFSCGSWEL